jgi:hypothetical protein
VGDGYGWWGVLPIVGVGMGRSYPMGMYPLPSLVGWLHFHLIVYNWMDGGNPVTLIIMQLSQNLVATTKNFTQRYVYSAFLADLVNFFKYIYVMHLNINICFNA